MLTVERSSPTAIAMTKLKRKENCVESLYKITEGFQSRRQDILSRKDTWLPQEELREKMNKEDRDKLLVFIMNDIVKNGDVIKGWFWDAKKENAIKGTLVSFTPMDHMPYKSYTDFNAYNSYSNFSLTNPNAKRIISSIEEAKAWIEKNPLAVLLCDDTLIFAREIDPEDWAMYLVMKNTDNVKPEWVPFKSVEVV